MTSKDHSYIKFHLIYARNITELQKQLNQFFEGNPVAEILTICSVRGIVDGKGNWVDREKFEAEIVYL